MTKTYFAVGTILCIKLFVDGFNFTIEFYPTSNYYTDRKGSAYTTNNPIIQKGIEEHPYFGTKVFLVDKNGELTKEIREVEVVEAKPIKEYKHIAVCGLADAKSWLADNLGIEPSMIRTKRKVLEVAEDYNIRFEGLE